MLIVVLPAKSFVCGGDVIPYEYKRLVPRIVSIIGLSFGWAQRAPDWMILHDDIMDMRGFSKWAYGEGVYAFWICIR